MTKSNHRAEAHFPGSTARDVRDTEIGRLSRQRDLRPRFVIVCMLNGAPVEVLTRGNDGQGEIEWRTPSAAQQMLRLLELQTPPDSGITYHIVKAGRA